VTINDVAEEAAAQGWTVRQEANRWVFSLGNVVAPVAIPVTRRDLINLIDTLKSHGFVVT
jgi:hypothetical protein